MNRRGGVVARLIGRLFGAIRGQWAGRRGQMDFAAAKRRWGRSHPMGAPLPGAELPPLLEIKLTPMPLDALPVDAQLSALERLLAARAARQGGRR